MTKLHRNILIAFIVIPIIVIIVAIIFNIANSQPQPTQDEYDLLKNYCTQIATGIPIKTIEEKGIEVTKKIKEDYIEITLHTHNCNVTAIYPTNEKRTQIVDGLLYRIEIIEYQKGQYLEESNVMSIPSIIFYGIFYAAFWTLIVIATNITYFPKKNT